MSEDMVMVKTNLLRNDENIISNISVTDIIFDGYLGKWNYRVIPKVKNVKLFFNHSLMIKLILLDSSSSV